MAINPINFFRGLRGASRGFDDVVRGLGLSDDIIKGTQNVIKNSAIPAGPTSAWPRQATGLVGRAKGLVSKLPWWAKVGIPVVGGLAAVLNSGEDQQQTAPADWVNRVLGQPEGKTAAQMAAELNAANQAAFDKSGGSYRATLQQGLNDYLNNMNAYVAAQSPAIREGYTNLANQARATGMQTAAEAAGAGMSAADIYNQLAGQMEGLSAGEGLSSEGTAVSGLTGGMIEPGAADMQRAQGGSLSDYLTREGTIARDLGETIGTSYESQGLGTVAQMAAAANALGAGRRANLAEQLAAYDAQRDAQRMQLEMAANERNIQAQAADLERQRAGEATQIMVPQIWEGLSDRQKQDLGSIDNLYKLAALRPDLLTAFIGG